MGADGSLHAAQRLPARKERICRRHLPQTCKRRRRTKGEHRRCDVVQARGIRQIFLVAGHIAFIQLRNLRQRVRQTARNVQRSAVCKKIARERINRQQLQMVLHALPGCGKQIFQHRPHGNDGRPGVKAKTFSAQLGHFAAHSCVALQHQHALAGSSQPDGGSQPAQAGTNHHRIRRRHMCALSTLPRRASATAAPAAQPPSSAARTAASAAHPKHAGARRRQ